MTLRLISKITAYAALFAAGLTGCTVPTSVEQPRNSNEPIKVREPTPHPPRSQTQILRSIINSSGKEVFWDTECLEAILESARDKAASENVIAYCLNIVQAANRRKIPIDGKSLVKLFQENVQSQTIIDLLSIDGADGKSFFGNNLTHGYGRDFNQLEQFALKGCTANELTSLIQLKDNSGTAFFEPASLCAYLRYADPKTITNIATLAIKNNQPFPVAPIFFDESHRDCPIPTNEELEKIMTRLGEEQNPLGFEIYADLCAQAPDFRDTQKPNAQVIVSTYNYEYGLRKTLNTLRKEYDVHVRAVSTKEEFYRALTEIENIELLITLMHGEPTQMYIGRDPQTRDPHMFGNDYIITNDDFELKNKLGNVHEHATIILLSCSTGSNEVSPNHADYWTRAAPGRRVVAPIRMISIDELQVTTNPLTAQFVGPNQQDLTYHPK